MNTFVNLRIDYLILIKCPYIWKIYIQFRGVKGSMDLLKTIHGPLINNSCSMVYRADPECFAKPINLTAEAMSTWWHLGQRNSWANHRSDPLSTPHIGKDWTGLRGEVVTFTKRLLCTIGHTQHSSGIT